VTYTLDVYTEFYWGNLWEHDHLEDEDEDSRIILNWIFKKWNGRGHGLDSSG
jgi:hypothetical protein